MSFLGDLWKKCIQDPLTCFLAGMGAALLFVQLPGLPLGLAGLVGAAALLTRIVVLLLGGT